MTYFKQENDFKAFKLIFKTNLLKSYQSVSMPHSAATKILDLDWKNFFRSAAKTPYLAYLYGTSSRI